MDRPRRWLNPEKIGPQQFRALRDKYHEQPRPSFSAIEVNILDWYLERDRLSRPCFCVKEETYLAGLSESELTALPGRLGNALKRLQDHVR